MNRKATATIVMLVGVAFITVTLAAGLFSVGPAFEEMTDGFRPVMRPANLAALDKDIDALTVAANDFQTKIVVPAAQAAKTTPEKFAQQLGAGFPAVMKGLTQTPAIASQFKGVVGVLSAERIRFERADAIPSGSLPATAVPWSLFVSGVVLVGVGGLVLRPGRAVAGAALLIGLLLVAVPLALTLPAKASAADTMNDHLKPVYTQQLVTGAQASLATMRAMADEMQTKMLPAFAAQAGLSVAEFQKQLALVAPGLAIAIQTMPAALERFTDTVGTFDANLSNYDAIKSVSLTPIVWTVIAGGAVIFVVAAASLVRRPRIEYEVVRAEFPRAA